LSCSYLLPSLSCNAKLELLSNTGLAATSGGEGDSKLLLWNILRGELVADLNAAYRQEQVDLPSMDALKICDGSNLICGSDSPGGKPAVVQIWDIDALSMISSVPAHDTVSKPPLQPEKL
jgi:hypothetical protein